MKNIVAWFVKNPVAANLLMVLMFITGIFGYLNLEREFIPQTTINGMTVSISWPGASPRDVEEQLVVRVEEAIDGLDGIDYIEGTAVEGSGEVTIITKLGIDYEKLVDEVQGRVDTIQNLPPDSFRPEVRRLEARFDIMYLALHGDVDRLTLQRAGEDLRRELTQLTGLQLTNHVSKIPEQVTIEVSEDNLRRFNLTFNDVAQAIRGSSVNQSAGVVETRAGNLQLRTRSLASDAVSFGEIIVRQTQGGGIIRVSDIATIKDDFEVDDFDASFAGQPTAIFQVLSPDTMNITASGNAIRKFEKEIQESLPPGLTFTIWVDGSTVFDSRMSLIGSNALSGLVLVLIILILFLRPAVAIWVTIGITAAFAGAIGIAPFIGITLNMISLFAFLLVIGIVVDDAIVVGEAAHLHVENGISGERGAIGGANMVIKPVYFAVITTIMMFIPFMLMSGPIRAIFEQISLVVIAVLIFSLIEAFFVLPAHLRHMKPVPHNQENRFLRFQNKLANGLVTFAQKRFRPIAGFVIRFRYATLATFIGLFIFAVGLLQAGIAPTSFIPEVEGDMIQFDARLPEGTTFGRLEQIRSQLDNGIETLNENAKSDFGIDGDIITRPGTITNSRSVQGFLGLISVEKRTHISTKEIADKLEEYVGPVPDAFRVRYNHTQDASGGRGGLFYGIASSDFDALSKALLEVKAELDSYAAVSRTWDGLESSAQEMQFVLKPGAETLGISLSDVTTQVRQAFFGLEVQRLPRGGEDVRVMVRYPESARESIDSLETLRIRTAAGVEVPLYSIADVNFREGATRIRRRDRQVLEFTGARIKGDQSEKAKIQKDLNENFFPDWEKRHPKVTRVNVGDNELQNTFAKELQFSGIAILIFMYVLLAIAFKSYAQPLLIMIAIPFAFVGMVIGNAITQVPFGMMSIFGFFAAAGVAVNDNLVLIDYVNRLRAKGTGAYQAMMDACVSRFRPILLTSVTTFVGITPILFETSSQAQFLKPMVVALAFGVLFDFFLTLMLVPALYGIGVDLRRFGIRVWTRKPVPMLGSTYDPELALALDDMELDIASDDKLGASPQPAE